MPSTIYCHSQILPLNSFPSGPLQHSHEVPDQPWPSDDERHARKLAQASSHQLVERQLIERRRQRLESLGTLASGIVHDLNNLLTPILMSSRMLQREGANVDRAALLETITSSASRGADLVGQLLTFARGGEGQHVPLQVELIIPEVIAILRHTLSGTVDLKTDVETGLPTMMGDETEISQVVMNLAINARDAMMDAGTLSVRARSMILDSERSFSYVTLPAGHYLAIEVSDSGSGIKPEVRERMFDPFFTTKPRGQGTGLGLSTSLGIIRSHGGAIDVQSTLGKGTTITVLFPVAKSDDDLTKT
ncbi:sensor histidine kinase [Rubripirellula reticaptiva]|uniref:histidine kinase n=1 Tax=Rubripirellula reticaptiva TaxID=2528013 RepID=A0A5C6EDS9_9BACT|nr:ATP-binding protein [Rubripirellula reticaptiva]TWU46988.1 Wide host range VirA protein [Rubripirellula reticaptiva]